MTKLGLVTKIYPRIIVSVCAILAIACGNILTKIDKETELQFPILSLR